VPGPYPVPFKEAETLAAAEELYRKEDYKGAEELFGKVAEEKKTPPMFAEKARFFEAECQRMQLRYPDAAHTFNRMLNDFKFGVYREKAVARIFDIANYWLDDTRRQLEAENEKKEGKRMFVPWNFVHTDKTRPFLDEEGNALKMMENVYLNDPTGPHAEQALYMSGYVQFHRGNYKEADYLLSQLIEMDDKNGKKSKLRNQAIELCILAKNNSTGGPAYDPRKLVESLKLIHDTKMSNPEMATEKGKWLDDQAKMIRYMQAEKDYQIAEFYMRTGHPASAWFYYELVRRRYYGTEFHEKAVARMTEIHSDLLAQQNQSEFAKLARQKLNKWALGIDPPMLKENQPVPKMPGEVPDFTNPNQVAPVKYESMPADMKPPH